MAAGVIISHLFDMCADPNLTVNLIGFLRVLGWWLGGANPTRSTGVVTPQTVRPEPVEGLFCFASLNKKSKASTSSARTD